MEIEEWRAKYGVIAGITSADGGLDLALWGASPALTVMQDWQSFMDSYEGRFQQYVVGHQVHGRALGVYEHLEPGMVVRRGLDGHATRIPGIMLTVLVADCVPVYLLDPARRVIVLLHAGWRGIAAGILEAGIEQLEALGAGPRSDLVMHCGVSICGECYEVGPEVVLAVCGRRTSGPETVDLRGVLADHAVRLGIRDISTSAWCTAHDAELFHSHRSNGGSAGRMAAYLGVPLS
jgi:YfiH family protein